jgi:hypothetical protein
MYGFEISNLEFQISNLKGRDISGGGDLSWLDEMVNTQCSMFNVQV